MSAQQKGLPEDHWIILNHFEWTITIETKMSGFNQMIALKNNYFNCNDCILTVSQIQLENWAKCMQQQQLLICTTDETLQ